MCKFSGLAYNITKTNIGNISSAVGYYSLALQQSIINTFKITIEIY